MNAIDRLGRRNRIEPQTTDKRVTPQARDLQWFQKLHEHGPLPSSFLLRYARDTHRSEKRAKERLTDLFNEDNTPHGGPYLSRPPQQFRTIDSRYNQLVYELTPASVMALKQAGRWSNYGIARSGPWLHALMVSSITASIELATLEREDIRYLSQSFLLERAGAELRHSTRVIDPASGRAHSKDLIPDALFGLEYHTSRGSQYRCFLVEADRATEPATTKNFNRKSWQRNLQQYEDYLGRNLYRAHLKLKAPLMVLNVVSDTARLERVMRLASAHAPTVYPRMLFQSWEDFGPVFTPPKPNGGLLENPWSRASSGDLIIGRS